MAGILNVTLGYIICLSLISNVLTDTDECKPKGPCKCEFSNGTGIDLNPSQFTFHWAKTYQSKEKKDYTLSVYYFHPCSDAKPLDNASTLLPNSSIYRYVETLKKRNGTDYIYDYEDSYEWLGNFSNSTFSKDGRSMVYYNTPSYTTVLLICVQDDDNLMVSSVDEPNALVLKFYSRNACLKQIDDVSVSQRSFGSTLLIIFFSCVIFYLVLGILTKKFLMGATGIEVIPNLAFWTDLPGLCRDGWVFMRNGFKVLPRDRPSTSNDPNSYDSI